SAVGLTLMLFVAEGCASHRRPPTSAPRVARGSVTTFQATAYCHGVLTAAGTRVRAGVVAADPRVLPLGTRIRVTRSGGYDGTYTVLDTGSQVRGQRLDLFIPNCDDARAFGRRTVVVSVIGSNPVTR